MTSVSAHAHDLEIESLCLSWPASLQLLRLSKCDMLQISSCTCQENCLKKRFNELKVLMRVKTQSEHSCQTSAARSLKWISLFTKATTIRGEKKKNSL